MRNLSLETSPEILRQAALLLERENRRLVAENLRLKRKVERLQGKAPAELALELESLEAQLALTRGKLFGKSSEKLSPARNGDFPEREPQRGHGPASQPALALLEQEHELAAEERTCVLCGGALDEWPGQFEESEEIDVIERRFVLVRHKRKKYRCRCGGCVKTASAPRKLLAGSRYSPAFAVSVAVAKYADHLPLERQVRIMEREGLIVSSQTLWDQIEALSEILAPLHARIGARVLSSAVVFADETRWEHLGNRREARKRWWVWGVAGEDAALYRILGSR
ncbi:MAG: transposase, partial [Chrysiogenetes bacterium]|nr:transposase [Chrysiogenetes bacterium]